jgi:glycosyltransferase involved in cell wall biosynthesis
LHILLIHQAFVALDEPGGTRHHELARFLAGRGHRVTVIASPISYLTGTDLGKRRQDRVASQDANQTAGVNILRVATYPALHKSFVHRVFSFFVFMFASFVAGLKVRKVDLVWGTSPPIFQGATAWALSWLKGVPFAFEVRDLWPAFAIQAGVLRNPLLIGLSNWLERFLYRHADVLVVNSPGFVEHVKAGGARWVELAPNGADPCMFDPQADGAEFRQAHGLAGKFIVLYAGAHGISNDLDVVLEAAKRLEDRPEIALVLLGDGKEKPNLAAQAAQMGLENLVFLPPAPKIEMAQALAGADACIAILKPIPLYATVYPNKVFDYMAAGRPVILAIDGVIREVVEDSGAGVFVNPGDPQALAETIRWMADHPQECRTMGLKGRQVIEQKFDRMKLAEELAKIFEGMQDEW